MSALRLRSALRGARLRLLLLLVVLSLGGVTAYHHGEPSGMEGMVSGVVCLAVLLGDGATLLLSAALARWRLHRPDSSPRIPRSVAWISPARGVPARAGPLYLRLSVLRR